MTAFESVVSNDADEARSARRHEPTWREQRKFGGAWVEQGACPDAEDAGAWDES